MISTPVWRMGLEMGKSKTGSGTVGCRYCGSVDSSDESSVVG